MNEGLPVQLLEKVSQLTLRQQEGKSFVLDPIRKKWIMLQPEELVRQLLLQWLIQDVGYSAGRIQVEKAFTLHSRNCRFDLVIYDGDAHPWMLVECKAPDVAVTQEVFNQISAYNLALKAPFLLVSNGRHTYCARMEPESKSWCFLADMPPVEPRTKTN